ncbi:MAG: hypothetical protein AABX29_02180 [Nanoarchaeota archaeon]
MTTSTQYSGPVRVIFGFDREMYTRLREATQRAGFTDTGEVVVQALRLYLLAQELYRSRGKVSFEDLLIDGNTDLANIIEGLKD